MCVQDSEFQSEIEMITLMEVKTQEQVLKLFSACVVIILFKSIFGMGAL